MNKFAAYFPFYVVVKHMVQARPALLRFVSPWGKTTGLNRWGLQTDS